jgi:hypothetical protein
MENGWQEIKLEHLNYWIAQKCERKIYNKKCEEIYFGYKK